MESPFQCTTLVSAPCYPNSIVWSDENLIAVASGRHVTILVLLTSQKPVIMIFFKIFLFQLFRLCNFFFYIVQNPVSVLAPKGTIGIPPGMPLPIGVVMRERKGPLLILCPDLRIITCFWN